MFPSFCHSLPVVLMLLASLARGQVGDAVEPQLAKDGTRYASGRLATLYQYYVNAQKQRVIHGEAATCYDLDVKHYRTLTRYRHGQKHGLHLAWHPNGQKHTEGYYDADRQHGPWITWNAAGQKIGHVTYNQGQPDGVARAWNDAGQLLSEMTFVNGQRQGPEVHYYPDGKVRLRGSWVNHQLDGVASSFAPDGQQLEQVEYAQGKKHGTERKWAADGTLLLQATWQAGVLNGPYLERDPQGTEIANGTYRAGERWSGRFQEIGFAPNQYWYNLYVDGQVTDGTLYEDGKPKTGDVTEEHAPGFIKRRIAFVDGRKSGPEVWFYINGNFHKRMSWKNNQLDGTYEEFWENGKLAWRLTLVDGKREGPEIRCNMRGDTIAEGIYRNDQPWDGIFDIPVEMKAADGTVETHMVLQTFRQGVRVNEFGGKPLNDDVRSVAPPVDDDVQPEPKSHANQPRP